MLEAEVGIGRLKRRFCVRIGSFNCELLIINIAAIVEPFSLLTTDRQVCMFGSIWKSL